MAERRTVLYVLGGAAALLLLAGVGWVLLDGDSEAEREGTRDEPLPMGTPVDLGNGWTVTVNSAEIEADALVAAAEDFNEPPPPGKRYVVVNLSATNNGEVADAPEVGISLFGTSGVEHDGGNLVTPPLPRFDTVAELDPGDSTQGNLVFVVDNDETDLELRLQPLIAVEGDQSWVKLDG